MAVKSNGNNNQQATVASKASNTMAKVQTAQVAKNIHKPKLKPSGTNVSNQGFASQPATGMIPNQTTSVDKVDKYRNFSTDALRKNINLLKDRNTDVLNNTVDPAVQNWIKQNEPKKEDFNNKDAYLKAKARFLETVDYNFGAGAGDAADYERWRKNKNNGGGNGDGNGGGGNDDDGDGYDDDTGMVVVPGEPDPNDPNQINVVDYAGQIVRDPSLFLREDDPNTPQNESMWMEDHLKEMKKQAGTIDESGGWSTMDSQTPGTTASTTAVGTVGPKAANSYDVQTTQGQVGANQLTAAQGTIGSQGQVEAAQADMKGLGTGVNEDGSVNYAGEALKKYAAQDISNIIDTSTVAGKLLAQSLGEGNYTDSKATLKGQLEVLQSEFVDPNTGEARIPSWAAATARNVSKIAAFKGMTGSAATAAMSQALLEASIPIAQADSQFFQTLTIQNLTNRQQSVINTANTLAKFEQTNVDNRMAAAIQNAKSFVDMDMKNLDNEQQSRVINNQNMIQSILEDAKQENAKRLFVADNQNEMDKFYDNLNTQISQFNSSQTLDASKFNATMADSREKFYKEMQYNINVSNAKWRQTVEVQEDAQQFEAAATDVKNMYDIGVNQLNQLWDRSDALLDYAWQSQEKKKDRKSAVALAILNGQIQSDLADQKALGALAGLAFTDILKGGDSTILGGLTSIFG